MEAPACSRSNVRQQRRSKSQRDRDRRRLSAQTPPLLGQPQPLASGFLLSANQARGALAVSASSGSEQEQNTVPSGAARPRPPRRRRKEAASSCEEEIIDGFAIASFVSLEALEKDIALKPPERLENRLKHTGKRKRSQENRSELEEPENSSDREQTHASGERDLRKWNKKRTRELRWVHDNKRDRGRFQKSNSHGMASDGSLNSYLETGYICDTESDSEGKVSSDGLDTSFTVSTSKALDPSIALHGSSEAKFSILPKISGLERSHEKNQEPEKDPLLVPFLPKDPPTSQAASLGQPLAPVCTSAQAPKPAQSQCQTPHMQTAAASRATYQPKVRTSQGLHQSPVHLKVPPFNPQSQGIYNGLDLSTVSSSRSSIPSKPLAPSSQISHRPSTPSLPIPLSNHSSSHSFPSALRPSSHHHPSVFTPSPGLPPPPPLLQVAGHSAAAAAVAAASLSEQELIRQDLSSRFLTAQGGTEMSTTIRPMFQFHQHNHQHQHTHQHTHQHFTPFPPSIVPAQTPSMFDKYPGKIDGLYRQNFYTAFSPSISGIPSVLPPSVSFGSLQGAFQPKSTNPDLPTRLGAVPPSLPQKAPQITNPFRSTLRKPGKWCAMHVRVAYMILRHQEKIKLMQGDPHKLDFRNDLITCLPNSGAFGTLSHSHELARPATLFTPTGAIHPSGPHYGPPSASHSSFLSPAAHMDPFGRTAGFTPLGALTNGAFGGLGNPAFNANTMFSQKDSPGAQGLPNSHDPWNRLHRTPPSFPTAPTQVWSKTVGEAERGQQEIEKQQETLVVKDEKDRDILFARHTVRSSPATPNQKLPMGHSNGRASVEEEQQWACGSGNSDLREKARSRSHSREHPEVLKDQKLREISSAAVHCITEENLVLARDTSKASTRELSPYIRAPIGEGGRPSSRSGGDCKPQLTPELAGKKQEVKVKEERKDDHDVMLTGFEMAQPPQTNGALHASVGHSQAAMHLPLHMPPSGVHSLSVFERPRGMTPFVGHSVGVADRFPHASYALETWREPYRSVELERRELLSRELAFRADPLHRLTGPRYYEREPERAGSIEERTHILREDYERARLYSVHPTGLEAHLTPHHSLLTPGLNGPLYSRISPSMIHQNSILGKTPPVNMLSAPPPLIPSASTRPGSPRRTTPLTASDMRDLSSAYKDRDSR